MINCSKFGILNAIKCHFNEKPACSKTLYQLLANYGLMLPDLELHRYYFRHGFSFVILSLKLLDGFAEGLSDVVYVAGS